MSTPAEAAGPDVSAVPGADGALLQVTGLTKHFPVTRGVIIRQRVGAVQAVDQIDFSVPAGTTLGLVGESGCGKTTTGRLLTRLLEPTAAGSCSTGTTSPTSRPGRCGRAAATSR